MLYDYYMLRFQNEFSFRDAKEYLGLEDFTGVKETIVGLFFFIVNLSCYLLDYLRASHLEAGLNDFISYCLKLYCVRETLKIAPENLTQIPGNSSLNILSGSNSSARSETANMNLDARLIRQCTARSKALPVRFDGSGSPSVGKGTEEKTTYAKTEISKLL